MTRTDLHTLIRYNDWANDRIFSCVEKLSDEQFARVVGGSFPSIRETIAHLVLGEWVWTQRWKGVNPTSAPGWSENAVLADLRRALREIEAERLALISTIGEEDLLRPRDFTYMSGAAGRHSLQEMIVHVVNHSTYHRGQVVTMLRQVGGAPISTDMVIFYSEEMPAPTAA